MSETETTFRPGDEVFAKFDGMEATGILLRRFELTFAAHWWVEVDYEETTALEGDLTLARRAAR